MKKLLFILLASFLLFSCEKEVIKCEKPQEFKLIDVILLEDVDSVSIEKGFDCFKVETENRIEAIVYFETAANFSKGEVITVRKRLHVVFSGLETFRY